MTTVSVEGTFTSTGQSDAVALYGDFNISLSGFGAATVSLERSFDDGANWRTVKDYTDNVQEIGQEIEGSVLYRWNCTAFTSGTIAYRLSR